MTPAPTIVSSSDTRRSKPAPRPTGCPTTRESIVPTGSTRWSTTRISMRSSISCPSRQAREIMDGMRQLMLDWLPLSVYPLEIRVVAGDDAWLSPNYQRDNLVVSISGEPGTDYWPYLRACDALFAEFGGRPHWGKIHFMTPGAHRGPVPPLSGLPRSAPAIRSERDLPQLASSSAVRVTARRKTKRVAQGSRPNQTSDPTPARQRRARAAPANQSPISTCSFSTVTERPRSS